MATSLETANGYQVEFPQGLEGKQVAVPGRHHACVVIPFSIRGEPGLLDVRFRFRKVDDRRQDIYHEVFSAVLRPTGLFTNFVGDRRGLRGEVAIPERFFPVELVDVEVENLSNKWDG